LISSAITTVTKYGRDYVTQSMEEYQARLKANVLNVVQRKAAAIGLQRTSFTCAIAQSSDPLAIATRAHRDT
jgi:hypothetical protein